VNDATSSAAFGGRQVEPVSLAAADLDRDGTADIVVGYNASDRGVTRFSVGNSEAFAPQNEAAFQRVNRW